jgi:hypothetical protein
MIAVILDLQLNGDTIVALITLAGTGASSVIALAAAIFASRANKAVNGRAADEPIIYDMVKETRDKVTIMENWRDDYKDGPLDSGQKVDDFVHRVDAMGKAVSKIPHQLRALADDIKRYGCPIKLGQGRECLKEESVE